MEIQLTNEIEEKFKNYLIDIEEVLKDLEKITLEELEEAIKEVEKDEQSLL